MLKFVLMSLLGLSFFGLNPLGGVWVAGAQAPSMEGLEEVVPETFGEEEQERFKRKRIERRKKGEEQMQKRRDQKRDRVHQHLTPKKDKKYKKEEVEE